MTSLEPGDDAFADELSDEALDLLEQPAAEIGGLTGLVCGSMRWSQKYSPQLDV